MQAVSDLGHQGSKVHEPDDSSLPVFRLSKAFDRLGQHHATVAMSKNDNIFAFIVTKFG
jgi:hypothetical protein